MASVTYLDRLARLVAALKEARAREEKLKKNIAGLENALREARKENAITFKDWCVANERIQALEKENERLMAEIAEWRD